MTQLGQGLGGQTTAGPNIFTVLVVVAFVVLAVGVGYVWYKHQQLFETHPFTVEPSKTANVFVRPGLGS